MKAVVFANYIVQFRKFTGTKTIYEVCIVLLAKHSFQHNKKESKLLFHGTFVH